MSKAKVRSELRTQKNEEKKLKEEKARNEKVKNFFEHCESVAQGLMEEFRKSHKEVDDSEIKKLSSAINKEILESGRAVIEGTITEPTDIMKKLHDEKYKTLEEFYKDNWEASIETVLPSLKKPEPKKVKRVPKVVSAEPKSKKPEKPESKPETKPVSSPEPKPELEPKKLEPKPVKKADSGEKKVEVVSTTGEKFQAFIYSLSVYSDEEPIWVCYGFDGGKGVFLDKESADVGRAMTSKKVVTLEVMEFEKPLVLGEARKTYWKVVGVYNPSDYEDKPIGKSLPEPVETPEKTTKKGSGGSSKTKKGTKKSSK